MLYASSDRLTCFLETLARFRPDPHLEAISIESDPRDAEFPMSGMAVTLMPTIPARGAAGGCRDRAEAGTCCAARG